MREADVGDEGADPEPDPGPEGWQEPRATGADAGCHCREVGFRLYMANESYRKFLVTLSAVTSRQGARGYEKSGKVMKNDL